LDNWKLAGIQVQAEIIIDNNEINDVGQAFQTAIANNSEPAGWEACPTKTPPAQRNCGQ
jgi:hypothetical protein